MKPYAERIELGSLRLGPGTDLFFERAKVHEFLITIHESEAFASRYSVGFSLLARELLAGGEPCELRVGFDRGRSASYFSVPAEFEPLPEALDAFFSIGRDKSDLVLFCASRPLAGDWGAISVKAVEVLQHKSVEQLMQELFVTNTELKDNLAELRAVTLAKTMIEGELLVGKDIQMGMLPTAFPHNKDYDLHARLLPAKEVGGDFYDFFELNDGRLCFSVGDVSGKGVGAALFMAMAKTLLNSKARENIASPAEAVSGVNAELSRDNSAFLFITLFTCLYDPNTGQLAYTNAGHNPPLLKRNGELTKLAELHGPVVGIQEDARYGFATVPLQENDQLILFTDGVTEAMDVNDEFYGDDRLDRLVQAGSFESAEEIVDTIFTDVEEFATGAEQADDITVLTINL